MRVTPGRHTIEAADSAGRFRRAGWVDVSRERAARFEAMPIEDDAAASSAAAIAARKHQLATGLDHARLHQCTRRLAKSGLTDTFVQIEITVDAAGAVNVLNIIDTDLPSRYRAVRPRCARRRPLRRRRRGDLAPEADALGSNRNPFGAFGALA